MKKILSLVLAAVMALSLVGAAFAEDADVSAYTAEKPAKAAPAPAEETAGETAPAMLSAQDGSALLAIYERMAAELDRTLPGEGRVVNGFFGGRR